MNEFVPPPKLFSSAGSLAVKPVNSAAYAVTPEGISNMAGNVISLGSLGNHATTDSYLRKVSVLNIYSNADDAIATNEANAIGIATFIDEVANVGNRYNLIETGSFNIFSEDVEPNNNLSVTYHMSKGSFTNNILFDTGVWSFPIISAFGKYGASENDNLINNIAGSTVIIEVDPIIDGQIKRGLRKVIFNFQGSDWSNVATLYYHSRELNYPGAAADGAGLLNDYSVYTANMGKPYLLPNGYDPTPPA